MIHGMSWYELLYLNKLKKKSAIIDRYKDNNYNELTKFLKFEDKKAIHSLINMNK